MRDWEEMFSKLHKDYFKEGAQTKAKGIQATINPAMMVAPDSVGAYITDDTPSGTVGAYLNEYDNSFTQ